MGILNVTPDSFSDGGEFFDIDDAINQACIMEEEGADIIDIGGESSRPGAEEISAKEELKRISPVLKKLLFRIEIPVSVDTYKSAVAEEVLEMGVDIINDIKGLQGDNRMAEVVASYSVPVVIMHNARLYEENSGNIIEDIKYFFNKSINIANKAGISDNNIILDPGIGFGTNQKENLDIMRNLKELKKMGYPLLLGTSRKSMLGRILNLPPQQRLEGTIATTVMGIMQGVDIVRVHDVKENLRAIQVVDEIYRN